MERNDTDTCNNFVEAPENHAEWKKLILKGFMLYDSIFVTFWNDRISE